MKPSTPEDEKVFTTGTRVSDSRAWMFSLVHQAREAFREWRTPSPRAEITATPLEVGELWSKRRIHIPGLLSLLAHIVVVAIVLATSVVSYVKPKPVSENSVMLDRLTFSPPSSGIRTGGGGGGMRSPTDASRGVLPDLAQYQIVPPTPIVVNMAPELAVVPTIVSAELPTLTNRNLLLQMGDPNGVSGPPSGGPGKNNGIGDGDGGGVGSKNGPFGPGPGNGPGASPASPVVFIGLGGASPPSCPLPATEPNYTDDARKARIQGTVSLDVIVNKDGSVTVSNVARKLGYGLDDEASRFVSKHFRCKPGVFQGQSVATPVRIDVNFHLY
jgi:periplasmic protein TonB